MADTKNKVLLGTGIAALAAGIYFYKTDAGKRHAKKLKGWMIRMKGEIVEKLEEVGEVTQPIYEEIVDKVAKAQTMAGSVPKSEIMALAEDLKKNWHTISRMVKSTKTAPRRKATAKKTTARRRTKKTGK